MRLRQIIAWGFRHDPWAPLLLFAAVATFTGLWVATPSGSTATGQQERVP